MILRLRRAASSSPATMLRQDETIVSVGFRSPFVMEDEPRVFEQQKR